MKHDCHLCSKGPAKKIVKNCYGVEFGVCNYCFSTLSNSVAENKSKSNVGAVEVAVKVDTTELDGAIKKSNQLLQLTERIDTLAHRSAKTLEKMLLEGRGSGEPKGIMNTHCTAEKVSEESSVPLLVIEVKDMDSIPTVYYQGEKIEGRVEVGYRWATKGMDGVGEHKAVIEHGMSGDEMTVRRIELRRFI